MKKTIKILSLIIVFVIGLFLITGCKKSNETEKQLYGSWQNTDIYDVTFTFNEDKTGNETIDTGTNKSERSFTYKIDDEIISIIFDDDEDELEYEYGYRFDNNNLVLIDSIDNELIYKKK